MTADDYRASLKKLVNKVPPSVNGGSVQYVRAYKKALDSAKKALDKPRATLEALQSAHNNLATFF